jgi:hypothetical protein
MITSPMAIVMLAVLEMKRINYKDGIEARDEDCDDRSDYNEQEGHEDIANEKMLVGSRRVKVDVIRREWWCW